MSQCYCNRNDIDQFMLQCRECSKGFHISCLKNGVPSMLVGDVFFHFTCANCNLGCEELVRMKLPWLHVVMLALYNLQIKENGKSGFFRWKEHICAFIDRHWSKFFGPDKKKKSNTWTGSVAGVLSSGCPDIFCSGNNILNETGWWKLTVNKPPTRDTLLSNLLMKKQKLENTKSLIKEDAKSRKASKHSFDSSSELKLKQEKCDSANNTKKIKLNNQNKSEKGVEKLSLKSEKLMNILRQDLSLSKSNNLLHEKDLMIEHSIPENLFNDAEETDSDIEVDPCTISPPCSPSDINLNIVEQNQLPEIDDILSSLDSSSFHGDMYANKTTVAKVEFPEAPKDEANSDSETDSCDEIMSSSCSDSDAEITDIKTDDEQSRKDKISKSLCSAMSMYEEKQLLKRLSVLNPDDLKPSMRRLKRKLIIREIKREKGLSLFNIDLKLQRYIGNKFLMKNKNKETAFGQIGLATSQVQSNEYRILDRYQMAYSVVSHVNQQIKFYNRLVGTEDDQLASTRSPYTARMLKPFIRRDYETKPLKMQLLKDIQAYFHRNDLDWKTEAPSPIDYCYVRPQHIASINAYCREFFWPGIDLSDCLKYPDFSCVVLYKKFVVGFAFLAPDVSYNEAYITFLFVHPEWRGAGIATFMIYHLIQTCIGKDVTLHVSASNPAMIIYQKFGFKPEELILNFYDKYFPEDSQECKNAFYMRLQR